MRGYFVLIAALAGACGADEECLPLAVDCTPQYEPTFANVHSRTLTGSCATGGGSCHATPTSSGGFSMTAIEDAYSALSARAADSTSCGVLVSRISSDNRVFQMPPGMPLSDGEQCAIRQWVEAGAPR